MVSLFWGKVHFLTPLGQNKFEQFSNVLCVLMFVFLLTFQNNVNYSSTLNLQEVIKFYNLLNKTFETDF